MLRALIFTSLLFLLVNCENRNENQNCCKQNSILIGHASIFKMQKSFLINSVRNYEDSLFMMDVLELSNTFENVIQDLIINSGGVEKTGYIFNPCTIGDQVLSIIDKNHLFQEIETYQKILNSRYSKTQHQNIIKNINITLDLFITGDNAIFRNDDELMQTPITSLINDLIYVQSDINSLLLVNMNISSDHSEEKNTN